MYQSWFCHLSKDVGVKIESRKLLSITPLGPQIKSYLLQSSSYGITKSGETFDNVPRKIFSE